MILYLNNFKGFSNAFIPLRRVNFLVGENSSGKTTVLSLLDILSKTSFWTSLQLNNSEFRVGPFQEIVNQFSNDKSFFQIGVEFESNNTFKPDSPPVVFRLLRTYKELDGNIIASSMKYSFGDNTYFFSQSIDEKVMLISMRKRHFHSFSDWIYCDKPKKEKKLKAGLMINWTPSLMKVIQDCYSEGEGDFQLFLPRELSDFTVLSPIRAEAHRIYESFSQSYSPQGEHIPLVLNRLLHSNSAASKGIVNKMCTFGKDSNLFDSIVIPRFGKSSDSPFAVSVAYDGININLTNVGFGVTQSLPLVVELLNSTGKSFSIQQPEVHLHPRAQAAFGELLYQNAIGNNNRFFCETHSDFIINRFRYAMNKNSQAVDSQVLFFTRDNLGTHVTQIQIDAEGRLSNVPDDYMSFFIDEELKMLEF